MQEARHDQSSKLRSRATSTVGTSEAALWGRLFDPTSQELPPEVARYILTLSFPETDIARMHKLAEKARRGTLTLEEQVELDNYEHVGNVLSLMKSKARKALKRSADR